MDTNIYKQLLFLVSQNTGIKLEKIIEQVLESNIYSMSEILRNENVKNLNNPEGSNKHYNSLHLFSRQNYSEYKNNKEKYINLSQKMISKLKVITLIEMLEQNKNLHFDLLYIQLDITDPFELDSIIFEAISQGLISGKVDQKNRILKALYVKGKDYISDISLAQSKINNWIANIDNSSNYINHEIEDLRSQTSDFSGGLAKSVQKLNDYVKRLKD